MGLIEAMANVVERADAWVNESLGMGGPKDQTHYTRVVSRMPLQDPTLDALYAEDGFAGKFIELLPRTALRPGWHLETPGNPSESAQTAAAYRVKEEELGVAQHFRDGAFWGRLFGGAVTWMGIDDGLRPELPVDETAIKAVRWLHTYDKREVTVHSYYQDPEHPKFEQPELFRIRPVRATAFASLLGSVTGTSAAVGTLVHESRLIVWGGQPTTERRRAELLGWDDSVLERAWDALKELNLDYGSKTRLVGRVSQPVYKIRDLFSLLAGKAGDTLKKRMQMLEASRNWHTPVLLDAKDEDFLNVSQPMAGVAELMDKGLLRFAALGSYPVSVFMGQSPAGLDATGDAEMELFYAVVDEWRTLELAPRHEKLTRLVLLSKEGPTQGAEPNSWNIVYHPLRVPDAKTHAETRKIEADTAAVYVDKGLTNAASLAVKMFSPSSGKSDFSLDEKDLDEALQRSKALANTPPKDNAELGTVGARTEAILSILTKVNQGLIDRASAKALLTLTHRYPDAEAELILGPATFVARPAEAQKGPAPSVGQGQGAGAPQGAPGFNAGGAQ